MQSERRVTCRYRRRNGEMCTGAAADPSSEILLCVEHLARAAKAAMMEASR